MASYWYDAYQRVWGDQASAQQWGNFAPFYKYFVLAPLFQALSCFGCLAYALPVVILMNISLYGISAFVFYLMVDRLIMNKVIALIALMFYAFSYLAVYLNALVLPDSTALSLAVISTGVVVLTVDFIALILGGIFLGIALAAKPFLVGFCPVFIWFIFLNNNKKGRIARAAIFTLALAVAPMMTIIENNHVSHGELKSLGAMGGVNFFQGWAKVTRVGRGRGVFSPGATDEPSWKPFNTNVPWKRQEYFYRLGINAIAKDPCVLFEKIFWFKKFFWGGLGPSLKSPLPGFHQMLPVVKGISYGMFICLGGSWFFFRRQKVFKAAVFLFYLLAAFFTTIYAIGMPERRYFLNIEFLVIALFFFVIDRAVVLYRMYRNEIWGYVLLAVLFISSTIVWGRLP